MLRELTHAMARPNGGRSQTRSLGAAAAGALAIGSFALGAMAIGTLAIGALAIGRFAVKKARIGTLEINELRIRKLRGRELVPEDSVEIDGPFQQVDRFSVRFDMDVASSRTEKRVTISKVDVDTVRDGKVVSSESYYPRT